MVRLCESKRLSGITSNYQRVGETVMFEFGKILALTVATAIAFMMLLLVILCLSVGAVVLLQYLTVGF